MAFVRRWRKMGLTVRVGSTVAFIGCSLSLPSCSPGSGKTYPDLYVLEVSGSQSAFATFEVAASGLDADPGTTFSGNAFLRRFRVARDLSDQIPVLVTSRTMGSLVSRIAIWPFVCSQSPDYIGRASKGWSATETHQIRLLDEGTLARDTNFDRKLFYSCVVESPSGGDGSGTSTPISKPMFCDQDDRNNTSVALAKDAPGPQALGRPDECQAFAVNDSGGGVSISLSFVPESSCRVSVQLALCFADQRPVLPLTMVVGREIPQASCRLGTSVIVSREKNRWAPTILSPSAGSWTIDSLDIEQTGRIMGDVDLTFMGSEQEGPVHLKGLIDLPILRLPTAGLP